MGYVLLVNRKDHKHVDIGRNTLTAECNLIVEESIRPHSIIDSIEVAQTGSGHIEARLTSS